MSDLSYKFTAHADPAVAQLQANIKTMTSRYYQEQELVDLIKATPDDVRAKFYDVYKLNEQHFMIDRQVLEAGSDDDISRLIARHAHLINAPHSSDIISIPLRRGLTKSLDTMYATTPPTEHNQLTASLGIFLSPDHQGDPSPSNEAGQNYLRALDYMMAKGFKINGHDWHWQPQMITCAMYPSLLPEVEKRGGDLDAAIMRESSSLAHDRHPSQALHALENYKSAKLQGKLANTGHHWQDLRQNGEILQDLWRQLQTALTSHQPEDGAIHLFQSNRISLTDFGALAPDMIGRGMSRGLDALITACDHQNKSLIAGRCLEIIGRAFSPAGKIDMAHDQAVLNCLDIAIKHGAPMRDGYVGQAASSALMIVMVAEMNRKDMLPALIKRGADLAGAKHLARNAYSCDEGGGNQEDLYPTAKKVLEHYRGPRLPKLVP